MSKKCQLACYRSLGSDFLPGYMPALEDPPPFHPHVVVWERGGQVFYLWSGLSPTSTPIETRGVSHPGKSADWPVCLHTWATQPYRYCYLTPIGLRARHTWATQPYRCCHLSLTGLCAVHTLATQPNRCCCLTPIHIQAAAGVYQ